MRLRFVSFFLLVVFEIYIIFTMFNEGYTYAAYGCGMIKMECARLYISLIASFLVFLMMSFALLFYRKPLIEFTKCPKCKDVFDYKDTAAGKCPHCEDVDTIEMKKYFEMYPSEKV